MRPKLHILPAIVANNWRSLDVYSGHSVETGAVVKADAYGLGVSRIAPELLAAGVRQFFVANIEEGVELRRIIGSEATIYVLTGYDSEFQSEFIAFELRPMICREKQLGRFARQCAGQKFGINLETGHNRLALKLDDETADELWRNSECLSLICSHLACADEDEAVSNQEQLRRFRACLHSLPDKPASFSGTDGIFLGPEYHFTTTRPGIGLFCDTGREALNDVVKLEATTLAVRTVSAGQSIGYGHQWTAVTQTQVATLEIGYADGLPREYQGRIEFYADGVPCPVIGRISMDLVNIDVTHLVEVPDRFELLGVNQTVTQFAHKIGAIPNSCLVRFGSLLAKVYDET